MCQPNTWHHSFSVLPYWMSVILSRNVFHTNSLLDMVGMSSLQLSRQSIETIGTTTAAVPVPKHSNNYINEKKRKINEQMSASTGTMNSSLRMMRFWTDWFSLKIQTQTSFFLFFFKYLSFVSSVGHLFHQDLPFGNLEPRVFHRPGQIYYWPSSTAGKDEAVEGWRDQLFLCRYIKYIVSWYDIRSQI